MTREHQTHRHLRQRATPVRSPLSQAAFNVRRYISRMSLVDAAAVILIWGNIIGLIAYPALGHLHASTKSAPPAPVVKLVSHKA